MQHSRGLQQLRVLRRGSSAIVRARSATPRRVLPAARQRLGEQRLSQGIGPLGQVRCAQATNAPLAPARRVPSAPFPAAPASSPAASSLSSALVTVGRETPNRRPTRQCSGNAPPTSSPSVAISRRCARQAAGGQRSLQPITRHRPPGTGSATPSFRNTLNARRATPRETPCSRMISAATAARSWLGSSISASLRLQSSGRFPEGWPAATLALL